MTDNSEVHSIPVAAAAAATAVPSSPPSFDDTNAGFSITESMISFLRMEAHLADNKAKRLRKQAAEIAKQFGITEKSQQTYDLDPAELPPLDEKGLPRYKGKKRGRKPKPKKRRTKPDRPKRKHTGYTLFMQEVYPSAKSEYPDLPSKELISLVARRWKELESDGRTAWKERAQQAAGTDDSAALGQHANAKKSDRNSKDRIDAAASGANLHIDNVEIREPGEKHRNIIGAGPGTSSDPYREENDENAEGVEEDDDEDISGDFGED